MKVDELKSGYLKYLREKQKEETLISGPYTEIDKSVFSDEGFKDYLIDEAGIDSSDVYSKTIEELMEMEIVNGEIIDTEDEIKNQSDNITDESQIPSETTVPKNDIKDQSEITESTTQPALEENSTPTDSITVPTTVETSSQEDIEQSNQTPPILETEQNKTKETENQKNKYTEKVQKLLDTLYKNKTVIKAIDIDKDGVLSDEEKEKFEEFIKGYDKESDELSETAIKRAFRDILDKKFSYDLDLDKRAEEIEAKEKAKKEKDDKKETSTPKATNAIQSTGGGGGGAAPTSSVASNNRAQAVQNDASNTDNMSLEALEELKSKTQKDLTAQQENLSAVYSGEDSDVMEAQEKYTTAEEEYKKAVDDDPLLKEINEDIKTNLERIDNAQKSIDETQNALNKARSQVTTQTSTVENQQATVDSLKAALDSYNDISPDDENYQEELTNKQNAKTAYDKAVETLEEQKILLEEYKKEETKQENALTEAQEELTNAQEEKTNLDKQVEELANDITKEKSEAFDKAKENLESIKTSKTQDIEKTISELQSEINEIDTKINQKQKEETEQKYGNNTDAKEFLSSLKATDSDAWNDFGLLCQTLGMSQEETADYLVELCNSQQWGNGCIDPVLLCAQIRQESGYNPTVEGDSGLALGLGQFHTEAVQEVNNQIANGTYGNHTYNNGQQYTAQDRTNPKKALEMMILLLRYDYISTGDTYAMLAMYNQGNTNGINTSGGQKYVRDVLARINQTY